MLSRVKNFFRREKGLNEGQVATLSLLPADERLAGLGVVLHDLCVTTAARFVEEERLRSDSPFRDLPETDLFHELLVMNFWVLESLFARKRRQVMDHVYRHYNASFTWGREPSGKESADAMLVKFLAYDQAWDDYSGHQDVFARQAIGIIFGDRLTAAVPQAAFWLISYADRTRKDFAQVIKSVDRLLIC